MTAKRAFVQVLKIVVSVGLIAFLLFKLRPSNLLAELSRLTPWPIVWATCVFFVSVGLGAAQWHFLLRGGGICLPFPTTFRVYFIGIFFNNFLPAGVGGDVMKIYDVTKVGHDAHEVFAVTLLDRIVGIAGLCVLALAASAVLWAGPGLESLPLYVVIFAGCVAPVLALMLNRRLSRWVRRLFGRFPFWGLGPRFDAVFGCLGGFRRLRTLLGHLTLLAMAVQFLRVVTHVLVAQALGVTITPLGFLQFFVFVPLLGLLMTLPISINGLGVREGAGILLFTQIGFSREQALLMELITYAIMVVVSVLGGAFFLQRSIARARPDEPREVQNHV